MANELCFTLTEVIKDPEIWFSAHLDLNVDGIEYSYDGAIWRQWTYTTETSKVGKHLPLSEEVGDKLYVRNKNNTLSELDKEFNFKITGGFFEVSGNVLAMINNASLTPYCFSGLFRTLPFVVKAPDLPSTELTEGCYKQMFYNTGIKEAPELPAQVLQKHCYEEMFFFCADLVKPPVISVKEVPEYACKSMFYRCAKLMIDSAGEGKTTLIPIFVCPTDVDISAVGDMFRMTGGPFKGTPEGGVTYGYYTILDGPCGMDDEGQLSYALTYHYDGYSRTLSFDGSGKMYNYNNSDRPWYDVVADIESIVLPEGLTTIGGWAFGDIVKLTTITIPASVETIRNQVFWYCSGLKEVIIAQGSVLNEIKSAAFQKCTTLENLVLPDTVKLMGDGVFDGCEKLNMAIPKGVESINYAAFRGTAITEIVFGDNLTAIGKWAFANCNNLSSDITFPATLASVSEEAFLNDTALDGHVFTFNSPQKPTVSTGGFNIGTSEKPVTIKALGSDWVQEGAFTETELGPYTTFVYEGPHDDYMYFVPTEDGCAVSFETTRNMDPSHIKYSFDMITWTNWSYTAVDILSPEGAVINKTGKTISVPMGQKLYVWNENDQLSLDTADNDRFTFKITGKMECHGNVMSMINFTALKDYCFNRLFMNCRTMLTAPELPSEITTKFCYQMMFYNCESMVTVPKMLPASLSDSCYSNMFYGCKSITETPVLSTINLVSGCYSKMFCNCESLYVNENGEGTVIFACPMDIPSAYTVNDMFAGTAGTFQGTPVGGNIYSYYPKPSPIITGQCGDGLFFRLDSSTVGPLEIYRQGAGTGTMWDFSSHTAPWYQYKDNINSVILPNDIPNIGDAAFLDMDGLTADVKITDFIQVIGESSFYKTGINSVIFGDSSLLQVIEPNAFHYAKLNGHLSLPKNLSVIGNEAFAETNLRSMDISRLTDPSWNTFANNQYLETVKMGEGVTKIGVGMFYMCPSLKYVVFSENTTEIGQHAFEGCINLEGDIIAPVACTTIESDSFNGCENIRSLTISENVKMIGSNAFSGCTGLNGSTLTIKPKSEINMAANCLGFGTAGHEVTVTVNGPEWATEAVLNKFANQYTHFIIAPPIIEGQCGDNLYFAYDTQKKYLEITGSGEMWDFSMKDPPGWFDYRTEIETVKLPDDITRIGYGAFYQFKSMKSDFYLTNKILSIGGGAFSESAITKIVFNQNLQDIGYGAFAGCENLSGTLVIPDMVKTIEESAFYQTGISGIQFGKSVSVIYAYAFAKCPNLKGEIVMPSDLTLVGALAFEEDYGITSIVFNSPNKPEVANNGFSIGTEKNPVEVKVSGPDWVVEGAFTDAELGPFTTFVYTEPPVPPKPVEVTPGVGRINRFGWYDIAVIQGTVDPAEYEMGGVYVKDIGFVPNIVFGVQVTEGYSGFFDIKNGKLVIYTPEGTEGVLKKVGFNMIVMKNDF